MASLTADDFARFARMARDVASRFQQASRASAYGLPQGAATAHVMALDLMEQLAREAGQREPRPKDAP